MFVVTKKQKGFFFILLFKRIHLGFFGIKGVKQLSCLAVHLQQEQYKIISLDRQLDNWRQNQAFFETFCKNVPSWRLWCYCPRYNTGNFIQTNSCLPAISKYTCSAGNQKQFLLSNCANYINTRHETISFPFFRRKRNKTKWNSSATLGIFQQLNWDQRLLFNITCDTSLLYTFIIR